MKPLLPKSFELEPYLKRIDQSRYYSNFGELVMEFESRLSKLFGAPVVTAASATAALTATIMSYDLPKGSLIACPSWSFVATAASIVAAGHVPYFVDVDERGVIHHLKHPVSAIIIVSPFGAPLDLEWFEQISTYDNIPIIIDAAAGFDSFSTICRPTKIPVVISTHCTKPFGTGEGGFVVCKDEGLLKKIRHITNFGIESYSSVPYPGFNGKMSEYHAAVGLAELDHWPEKREKWLQIKRWYGINENWASASIPIRTDRQITGGIKSRYGIHQLKAYENYSRTDLPGTEKLMDKTIMLPCWVDMKRENVDEVLCELQ